VPSVKTRIFILLLHPGPRFARPFYGFQEQ
jgi:hypothetical protein